MLQGVLNHLFVQLMKYVMALTARVGADSLVFTVGSRLRILSVNFWEGNSWFICPLLFVKICAVFVKFCGADVTIVSVIGGEATIICCGGWNVDFIKALEKSPGRKTGMEYPFSLTLLQFEQLLLKPGFRAMGKIVNMSVLRTLLLRSGAMLDERLVQSTQFFRRINLSCKVLNLSCEAVMGETFNPFIDQARHYLHYVAKDLLKHPSFKSDLVVGEACSDYGVLFHLSKPQAIDCYRHILQSFTSPRWLSLELLNVQMDDYVELVDEVRHISLDNFGTGPAIEDIFYFLSACPELAQREYTLMASNPVICVWVMLSRVFRNLI